MMSRNNTAVFLMVVLVFSGCSDVAAPDADGGDFSISVSSGTQPTYTWAGGAARDLRVSEVDDPLVPVWAVASTNPNTSNITSPFRHGTVPPQTTELADEQRTLTPGRRYRVEIRLLDQQRATRDFRP